MQSYLNASVRRDADFAGLFTPDEYRAVRTFYAARPDLAPTPLLSLPATARAIGIASLHVKDETRRFGLEAFKITGAMYALHSVLDRTAPAGVVCATAGNHGRAVARAARDIGLPCTVFLPAPDPDAPELERATRQARVSAMQADGARTVEVDGSYEATVGEAAAHAARTGALVVSDTAWTGYGEIPRLIMCGYTQLFEEASRQWPAMPDVVLVQGGVGGLVCAAANWFAARYGAGRPLLVACEPESHACLLASARAGEPIDLAQRGTTGRTIMAGLRCAMPSPAAWPSVHAGVDAFVAIPDTLALEAMARLARPEAGDTPLVAGPSGACGMAALLGLLQSRAGEAIRQRLAPLEAMRALVIVTESP